VTPTSLILAATPNCEEMKKDETRQAGSSLEEMRLGVWRVLTEKEIQTSIGFAILWRKITIMLPTIQNFVTDVYMIGPGLLSFIFLSKVWSGFEDVLCLHYSNKFLSIVSFFYYYSMKCSIHLVRSK
jgi:hypothetical protein